nr:hypothetical protein Itr_chr06CG20510 [Ipomoea trifida]
MAYFNEVVADGEIVGAAEEAVVVDEATDQLPSASFGDSHLQDIEGFAPTIEVVDYFNEADETASNAANTPSTSRQTKANTKKMSNLK